MSKEKIKKEPKITGTQDPKKSNKKNSMLSKDEIMFEIDEDGEVMPEKVSVEVYDKALDIDIMSTTMELDNALTMYESKKKSYKKIIKSRTQQADKLSKKIEGLQKLEKPTDEQKLELKEAKKELKDLEEALQKLDLEQNTVLQAYQEKINESREFLEELEKERDNQKEIKYIEAKPCTVAEAHKYFTKFMWTDEDGEWHEPRDKEDTTYISYLLANKVTNPKLSVDEWNKVKPMFRLSIKDSIAEISYYETPSPKEVLVKNRRSEKLKNIKGE